MSRFTEEEARQIFARAAERQHAVEARGPELTRSELEAIGEAAGLDPKHLAAAMAELRAGPPPEPVVISGIDLTPRRVRVLPVRLTDALWEDMVGRLRQTFGSKGIASQVGQTREWTSAPSSDLHLVATPVEGGTRVTLETSRADEAAGMRSGPLTGLGMAVLMTAFFAFGTFEPYVYIVPVLTMLFGVAMFVVIRGALRRWSEQRSTQFDALMDQFDLLTRAAPEWTPAEPTLELGALPDPDLFVGRPASRSRTRS